MPYRLVSEELLIHKEQIVDLWAVAVRRELPSASAGKGLALHEGLTAFITALAYALAGGKGAKARLGALSARAPLKGYALKQVLTEYRILRQVLFSAGLSKVEVPPEAAAQIHAAIDQDLARTVESLPAPGAKDDRDAFVVALSHDIRSPIAVARSAVEMLLLDFPLFSQQKKLGEILRRNLVQADDLIRDLLDVHRIRSGQGLTLALETLNLARLSRDVIEEINLVQGKEIVLDASTDIMGVWCPRSLRRMLSNLVSNAMKYGDVVHPIKVTLSQDVDATVIAVHNFGKTIAPADQSALFEPFIRRTDAKSAHAPEGWGLGLAVVKATAEAHGGAVKVSSLVDQGTTFTVILPNDAAAYCSSAPS